MNNKVILVDAINTFVIKWEGIYQPLYDLLESYPNRKIILTNADDEQMEKFGLNDMPYEVFTCKHKPDKNDRVFYGRMIERLETHSSKFVYFEHNIDAVESARSMWITTLHYDKDKKNIEAVKEFLDANL